MGQRKTYRCEQCEYSAFVGGGKQVGMNSIVWTIHCYDCAELNDVLVSDSPGKRGESWIPRRYACPEVKAHRVVLWSEGGACPKCEGAMIVDEAGEHLLWD